METDALADTNENKPIRGWLETLPEPYRQLALSQAKHPHILLGSVDAAVLSFTAWGNTHEGVAFWTQVHAATALNRMDLLPPLPEDKELRAYKAGITAAIEIVKTRSDGSPGYSAGRLELIHRLAELRDNAIL